MFEREILGTEKNNKSFWDRYARFYDFEILGFNGSAYAEMYKLMSRVFTKDMQVLEVATGTGIIAANIAGFVCSVEAVDFSPKMIKTAEKRKGLPENVSFSVEDATALSFADNTFDAAIISNALHIMPNPIGALANIKRVLKPGGLLIAPTYAHGLLKESSWNLSAAILNAIGFETYARWLPEEYLAFIEENGFRVENWRMLQAAFPLVYLEAHLSNGVDGSE